MGRNRLDRNTSVNWNRYFEQNGTVKREALEGNRWLTYLLSAKHPYWNSERLETMADKGENLVLEYVIRTLDILDEKSDLEEDAYRLLRTILCWSEVAKAGSDEDRTRWRERGYPLDIHNEASALIYADHFCVRNPTTDAVFTLIATHGLAGQFIRGECRMADSLGLLPAAQSGWHLDTAFETILLVLNECIIRAVDETIWERVQGDIADFITRLRSGEAPQEYPAEVRLHKLLPNCGKPQPETVRFFAQEIFDSYALWYFQTALEPFGFSGAQSICEWAAAACKSNANIRHLNFKPLADALYYDYGGKKHINVYKQRILEKYIADPLGYREHVAFTFEENGISLLIGVSFPPACEKLIDFCVEAERSGVLSYEKSIKILYDTFGFRRDSFDRLSNEESYLSTMNDAEGSTKLQILDYVTGETVVDVGSGGGVLLDALEARYPEKTVIGTDISQNVIEVLQKKRQQEQHHWHAIKHNFVEGPFPEKADSILFSSILHEIYSYTDLGDGLFDPKSLRLALENAASSLRSGGRIIIRDGVKTDRSDQMKILFKAPDGYAFFESFLQDFRGMDALGEAKVGMCSKAENTVVTEFNFGREFLYTYTWGKASFPHEVQECFGYYTLEEFKQALTSLGLNIVYATAFLEEGYRKHLSPLVSIYQKDESGAWVPAEFPDSNCIIVAQKP
ncbi:MAG: methyltransferase domain-containing protein [Clostridia bacterium]|nr:methyltransferase domain-containing protein [Clostridia bacterium]MBR2287719.1 methyltransferase domain-containing protein [Clostridia bacterium]